MSHFSASVLEWFDQHGRKNLPWQSNRTPYRVWLSEIMLQQTQVATVIPYFEKFNERFPTVKDLAAAELDQVLHLWTGLGYYARGRNLHKAAIMVSEEFDGEFPQSVAELETLPGIGRSTAGAIAALAMNITAPILDGNVKRVLTRHEAIHGWPEQTKVKNQLWEVAESYLPNQRIADYTQAMMDLGATLCVRSSPACGECPVKDSCLGLKKNLLAEIPGKKPKKALPVKSITLMVLITDANKVLLEKRPATGIWGGLFSLPEKLNEETQLLFDAANYDPNSIETLEPFRHTFSHYHLDISLIKFKATEKSSRIAESDRWHWYHPNGKDEVGLAAPIKKFLNALNNDNY
ncbi:MAG: A/G-specific adenine glycosylase [Pseudohongiellaceae bacterium]